MEKKLKTSPEGTSGFSSAELIEGGKATLIHSKKFSSQPLGTSGYSNSRLLEGGQAIEFSKLKSKGGTKL